MKKSKAKNVERKREIENPARADGYAKSSAASPLSFSMLLKTFGWSIFAAWKGTVTRLPSVFLNILWLPLCRTSANPLRSSAEIDCAAVMRGSRTIGVSLHRYLDGRKDNVFRFRNMFFLGGHVFNMELYRVMDILERFLIRITLGIAALQRGAAREVAIFVFLYNDGKAIRSHA